MPFAWYICEPPKVSFVHASQAAKEGKQQVTPLSWMIFLWSTKSQCSRFKKQFYSRSAHYHHLTFENSTSGVSTNQNTQTILLSQSPKTYTQLPTEKVWGRGWIFRNCALIGFFARNCSRQGIPPLHFYTLSDVHKKNFSISINWCPYFFNIQ